MQCRFLSFILFHIDSLIKKRRTTTELTLYRFSSEITCLAFHLFERTTKSFLCFKPLYNSMKTALPRLTKD
jgi:hypothetical protein